MPNKLGLLTADFSEPFLPTKEGASEQPLAEALSRYRADARPKSRKVALLETFLQENPEDAWAPSVRLSLGLYYHQSGRFTRALPHLRAAWEQLRQAEAESPRLKALADRALGEYALTLAHLGRYEELEPLLTETGGRSLQGPATELVAAAREGLHGMKTHPESSFLCGPSALRRVGELSAGWDDRSRKLVGTLPSTMQGTSLAQVYQLSEKLGLKYQMAYRKPGSRVLTPAVAHWKAGHFAAVLDPENGLYPVGDDTAGFGREQITMEAAALEEEASGYFLVPAGPLPLGWRPVSLEEGQTVWGRGETGLNKDGDATGSGDTAVGGDSGDSGRSGGGGNGGSGGGGGGGNGAGNAWGDEGDGDSGDCPMTTWSAHAMLVSLKLVDTPVGLSPATFAVPFRVTYCQREVGQPSIFDYSNLGPKWTSNWTSYVTDTRSVNKKARLYKPSGGTDEYVFATTTATTSENGAYSQATLSFASGGFTLDWPNGARDEYRTLLGGRYHLTSRRTPQGNTTTLEYDDLGRLVTIRDAVGRPMTIAYELSSDPLKITRVTDPFGRSASFQYTADGHLASVTDILGLVSSYQYGANDFINSLTTPYGTTTFTYGDISTDPSLGTRRFLQIVDAGGRTHRVEYRAGVASGVPTNEPSAPEGMPLVNGFLYYRNSFYWEPQQLGATLDYNKATIYHFLHLSVPGTGNATSRVLESVKKPLQNRVWFFHNGQGESSLGPTFFKDDDSVTHVGRVLSDGSTQLTKYEYNARGNVSQMTDPTGRVFSYTYAPNLIDMTSVSTGGQTLLSATYDTNHNILTLTDSSGQVSSFSYDPRGLLLTATNPLGESSTYAYTPTGNLASITGPLEKTTSFVYDSAERVASATDSEGYTAQVAYDSADRPVSLTYPDGTSDTLTYSKLDLVSTRDRIGRQTQMAHDALRRLTAITDANGGVTALAYGLEDGPRSLMDPRGSTTSFTYDIQQRMVSKGYPDGATQTVIYENCLGRVKQVTDALGHSKTYSYFLDNQLKSIVYSGTTPAVSFTNDSFLPRPLSMTDGQGTTAMTYVPVGSPGANRLASISGPHGDLATFSYDVAGRMVGKSVNGADEGVLYDQLWRPTSTTNALDTFQLSYLGKTGQVTGVTSTQGPTVQLAYAANIGDRRLAQIKNLSQAGTALSQFDYTRDPVGQITQMVETHGTATGGGGGDDDDDDDECQQGCCHGDKCCKKQACCKSKCCKGKGHCGKDRCKEDHGNGHGGGNGHHNGNGNGHNHGDIKHDRKHLAWLIGQVIKNVWGWSSDDCDDDDDDDDDGGGTGTSETLQFTYDNLSQLVGVSLNQTPVASYQFDLAGNLTSLTVNGTTTNFTYNSLNQPTSPGTTVFDAKGQTTEQDGRIFEWDDQGRITAIVQGTQRSEFAYDGLSRRTAITEMTAGTVTSKKLYWWLGGSIVCERDGLQPGFPITKRYFGQGVMQGTTKLYYTLDHLGSVRELLDATGNVVADYRYSTYGERTRVSGTLDSDFGYAGLFHHGPTGLDLATYRVYDAKLQRFISRDPLGEGVDYNLYRYVGNNPVNFLDPAGLDFKVNDTCGKTDRFLDFLTGLTGYEFTENNGIVTIVDRGDVNWEGTSGPARELVRQIIDNSNVTTTYELVGGSSQINGGGAGILGPAAGLPARNVQYIDVWDISNDQSNGLQILNHELAEGYGISKQVSTQGMPSYINGISGDAIPNYYNPNHSSGIDAENLTNDVWGLPPRR